MLTLHIEDADGAEKVSVEAQSAEDVQSFAEMRHGEATLLREAWADVDEVLDRRNDVLRLTDPTGETIIAGRFDDDSRGSGTVTVSIVGFERDAQDAEPTGPNVAYQNTADATIVTDLIDGVPTLEAGTISELAPALSMSFSHANPSKALRDVAEATGSEPRYNDDATVDYIDERGADKTSEITLSPANQNVVGGLEITEDAREEVTHIRGLGAQSGPDQITAEAAADSYADGEKQIWREYENKDVQEQSRLQRIIDRQVAEYDGEPRHLEIEVTTVGEDLELGDRVHVELPAENIDRNMRIVELTRSWAEDGAELLATLSNRKETRSDGSQEAREDLQKFNRGYQGFISREQAGGDSRQPVDDGINAETSVIYPDDVIEEHSAEVLVEGLPYRAYSNGGENNPPFDTTAEESVTGQTATIESSNGEEWQEIASISASNATASQMLTILTGIEVLDTTEPGSTNLLSRLVLGSNDYYPQEEGLRAIQFGDDIPDQSAHWSTSLAGNYTDISEIALEVRVSGWGPIDDDSYSVDLFADLYGSFDDVHTHPAEPGVIEEFDGERYYPSNCDVVVNGESMDVSLGDGTGTFSEFVDITGELTEGKNTVEVTSDTLGHVRATAQTELFRRGRTEE